MKTFAAEDVADRLRAWASGGPIPRFQTKCFELGADPFVVAFVRMGGEGRPWAIASGYARTQPTLRAVADPRVQPDVAPMVEAFGADLMRAFPIDRSNEDSPEPQIWLPDPSHLDLLHQMAFAYAYERWPLADMRRLNLAGKLFNSLFLQAIYPAQQTVMTATQALRSLYTFPASPVRQGHLGFLIEWLNDHGSRTARLNAASNAEERAVSTSIDGQYERRVLEPLLDRYVKSGRRDDSVGDQIKQFVEEEAKRRWEMAVGAIRIIRRDPRPRNPGIAVVRQYGRASWNSLWCQPASQESRGEKAYWRGRETDRAAVPAAQQYLRAELAERVRTEALAHGDREIATQIIRQGGGLSGKVVALSGGMVTVQYTLPEHLDARDGTTYKAFGDADNSYSVEASDPSARTIDLSYSSTDALPRKGQRLLLIEHAPPFMTTNKIDHMESQGTNLGQMLQRAAHADDEPVGPEGEDL